MKQQQKTISYKKKINKLVAVNDYHKVEINSFATKWMLLLLLLSHVSRVRLCATPQTAAHQAPPSLGFFRQEHWWVAISFSNAWQWKVKVKSLSRVRLSNPMDCSLPGSTHGISQARVLEWIAIAFSRIQLHLNVYSSKESSELESQAQMNSN